MLTSLLTPPLLTLVMLALIALIGGVVLQFTYHLLAGDPARPAALRRVAATLAGAAGVVLSPDLIGMALAWTATSLALHQLLSLDQARIGAQVAAHKKFLLSRLADVAIWSGILLLVSTFGTSSRADVLAAAGAMPTLPTAVHASVILLAIGVLLRTAQLPFHGWLLQVMETPTPFSALLHAGVINLGAFVLIALAPLVARVPAAQSILVISGTITALLAVLVMHTRANVKGTLAWSTVAQMGFVILECGLGAYELALLHVIAHALYKAHAFLRAGSTLRTRPVSVAPLTIGHALARATLAATLLLASVVATWTDLGQAPHALFTLIVLASAIIPWAMLVPATTGWRSAATLVVTAAGVPAFYAMWHSIGATFVPTAVAPVGFGPAALVPLLAFPLVAALSLHVMTAPTSRVAQWLYPHASAGFHLDDLFTRLTFVLWPPRRLASRVPVRAAALAPVIRRAA